MFITFTRKLWNKTRYIKERIFRDSLEQVGRISIKGKNQVHFHATISKFVNLTKLFEIYPHEKITLVVELIITAE